MTEAVRFLTSVVETGHIRRRALLAIGGRLVAKLQPQTSTAVLSAAAEFMAAASRCPASMHGVHVMGLQIVRTLPCSALLLETWQHPYDLCWDNVSVRQGLKLMCLKVALQTIAIPHMGVNTGTASVCGTDLKDIMCAGCCRLPRCMRC